MQSFPPKWSCLVLVCANERPPGAPKPSCGHQGASELRDWLKHQLKADGSWGRARVVESGCLDVCMTGVTVVINGQTRLVLDPSAEREALLAEIRASLAAS